MVLQVDDTFGSGLDTFLKDEEAQTHQLLSKPRKLSSIGDGARFNGAYIKRESQRSYAMAQTEKCEKLVEPMKDEQAVSVRAQIQYIAETTKADLASS